MWKKKQEVWGARTTQTETVDRHGESEIGTSNLQVSAAKRRDDYARGQRRPGRGARQKKPERARQQRELILRNEAVPETDRGSIYALAGGPKGGGTRRQLREERQTVT